MKAVIDWISEEQGGRRKPPSGLGPLPYSTVMRFSDEAWPASLSWSLVVKKVSASEEGHQWIANVEFLVDEAPRESLREGRDFELYEGWKCVARGKLVGESELAELIDSEAHGANSC